MPLTAQMRTRPSGRRRRAIPRVQWRGRRSSRRPGMPKFLPVRRVSTARSELHPHDSGTKGNMTDEIRRILRENGRLSADVDVLADDADLYQAGMTSHASVN